MSKLGWAEPVFYGLTEDGQPIGAFSPEQFEKLRHGMICPRCWQEFAAAIPKCFVCQMDMTQPLDFSVRDYPAEWTPGDRELKKAVRSGTRLPPLRG
jgi:hypothetical protein